MRKKPYKQILFGQNFLRSHKLVRELVGSSGIGQSNTVYEIGPGRGIITAELARRAGKVIAVEKDPNLVGKLRDKFRETENVQIIEKDFLEFKIREREYKVFASIPYNMTACVMRKILYAQPVPTESFLIMQREAARRFCGLPRETMFSIMAKPFYEFRVLRRLRRTDFEPVPAVDSVLLHIRKRGRPLVIEDEAGAYRDFVRFGFCRWRPHLRSAFKGVFTYRQWKCLSQELHFPLKATPTDLKFEQWVGLFMSIRNLRR